MYIKQISNVITVISIIAGISIISGCGGGSGPNGQPTSGVTTGVITATKDNSTGKEIALAGVATSGSSISINGVDYSIESTSNIIKDEDDDSLALGMVVTVKSHEKSPGGVRRADEIRFEHLLKGPVSAIDPAAGTLTVLGQTVETSTSTIFSGINDLNNMAVRDMVVVSGYFDADGRIQATRIGRKSNPFIANITLVKLNGTVSSVNGQTLTIGDLTITSVPPLPQQLAVGSQVKVKGTISAPAGPLIAMKVELHTPDLDEADHAEVEGIVANLSTADSTFTVGGLSVVATILNLSGLAENDWVEIEGRLVNGVLLAAEIKIKKHGKGRISNPAPSPSPTPNPAPAPSPSAGQVVYNSNCAGCHTLTGSTIMNLAGKGAKVSQKYPTADQTGHNGKILTSTQIADLSAFLNAQVTSTQTPTPVPAPSASAGQTVFTVNCVACHSLTGASLMNLSAKSALVSSKFPTAGASGHKGITLSSTQIADLKAYLN